MNPGVFVDDSQCTVIIPTYNNPEGAKALIKDFHRLHDPSMFRFISIDMTKEGIDFDENYKPHLQIHAYTNLGFARAMNIGWKLVTTPYTILANDDIRLLHSSWYWGARACLDRQGVLAVNPKSAIRTWDGAGNVVNEWDIIDDKTGIRNSRFDFVKDKPFEEYTDEDYEKLLDMHGRNDGAGTAMFFTMFKTEARDIIGLLDEAYINNGEDYDWNRRCYLTCAHCKKRKNEHGEEGEEKMACPSNMSFSTTQKFEPFHILTCTHALIHHQCGVTKQKAEAAGQGTTYDSMIKSKNIFNSKWIKEGELNPDGTQHMPGIYGDDGVMEPHSPWMTQVPL